MALGGGGGETHARDPQGRHADAGEKVAAFHEDQVEIRSFPHKQDSRRTLARYCRNSIPCVRVRIQIGDWPRRHSCARSHSLSSRSLLYPCPQPAPALTAVGAQITGPAIAGSTAPTP